MISIIFGYYEIEKFKHEKVHTYNETISKLVKVESLNTADVQKLWIKLLANDNILNTNVKDEAEKD